jgi:uncharacterized membrane protein YfcA
MGLAELADLAVAGTGLGPWDFILLCGTSFLGSFITAGLDLGGGVPVFATMALYLTPAALIPLHGVVQLGSNLGRTALLARHVLFPIVPAFLAGTVLGAAGGGQLVVTLPVPVLQAILALFVLYATWAPKFQASPPGKRTFFGVGAVGTFATMFVGATGPLIAPFVAAACKERRQVVATHAILMTIQHGFKILAFGLLGFAFGPYLPLLAGLPAKVMSAKASI